MALRKLVRDKNWVRQSFLVNADDIEAIDDRNRFFTTAKFKHVDTTPGGNVVINPPPQFTDNADLTVSSVFTPAPRRGASAPPSVGSRGIGRYYSEAIDDNSRVISMRFGVPQFNSLTTFFTGFYNSEAGTLARTGRSPSLFYRIGQAAGFIVPLLTLPLFLINLVGNAVRWLDMRPSSKYYYLKPTMPLYWNAVTSIVNLIAVNKNIVPRLFDDGNTRNRLDDRYPFTAADMQTFSNLLPDIAMEGGGINVYAMATRGQRLARRMYKRMEEYYANAAKDPNFNKNDALNDIYNNGLKFDSARATDPSFQGYLDKWFAAAPSKPTAPKAAAPAAGAQGAPAPAATPDMATETIPQNEADLAGFFEFLEAELDDGSQFVSFRVDAEGSTSESFSNQVGESEIASKLNSMSGASRSTNFSFAGGNLGDGLVAGTIQAAMGAVKDVVAGVADGLSMSGLAALGGAAFVDIPKHWQSSTANLPRMNYTFSLVSPYGNKMSQLLNLYVPLAMILAAALPLSTGKQSYTSPFLVELYDRGRAQTRLGMIDSLSITRGITNLAFNNAGEPMGIDVSFSVIDLSSVMHMPIVQGFSLTNPLSSIFDDDNTFTDYMAVLGSLSLQEQVYTSERFKLAVTRQMTNMKTWFSVAHATNFLGDLAPARLASIFYTGIVNR